MKNFFARLGEKFNTTRQREKAKMENMTWKQKIGYVSTAWGLEIVAVLAAIAIFFGCGYMLNHATKTYILSFGVVDSDISEEASDAMQADFLAYIHNDTKRNIIDIQANIDSQGGTLDEVEDYYVYEQQQQSLMLAFSGSLDCYICPESYLTFLKGCEDCISPVEDVVSEEMLQKYSHLLTEDGFALKIENEKARDYFTVGYEPVYLVYTSTVFSPEITMEFTDFVMEMQ